MDTKNVNESLKLMETLIQDLHSDLKDFDNEFKTHLNLNPFKKYGVSNIIGVIFPFINKVSYKKFSKLYEDLSPYIDYVLNNDNYERILNIVQNKDFKDHNLNYLTKYVQRILNIIVVHNSYIELSIYSDIEDLKLNYYHNWMANDKLDWVVTNLFDFIRNLLYYVVITKGIKGTHFYKFIEETSKRKTMKYFCKPTWCIRTTHDNYVSLFRNKEIGNMFVKYYNHVWYHLNDGRNIEDTINLNYRHYLQAFVLDKLERDHYLYRPRKNTLSELEIILDDNVSRFIDTCYREEFLPPLLIGAYCQQLYELFLYFNKE